MVLTCGCGLRGRVDGPWSLDAKRCVRLGIGIVGWNGTGSVWCVAPLKGASDRLLIGKNKLVDLFLRGEIRMLCMLWYGMVCMNGWMAAWNWNIAKNTYFT